MTNLKNNHGFECINSLLSKFTDNLETRLEVTNNSMNGIIGISTGFPNLDRMTSGLVPGELVVIASRPAMGKKTLASNIAVNVALSGLPVAMFNLMSSSESWLIRVLSSQARIHIRDLFSAFLGDDDFPRLAAAINLLADKKLFINQSAAISLNEIIDQSKSLASEHGQLGLIVIDGLHLIELPNTQLSRDQQITEIAHGLKVLAKILNVPIILVSRLNYPIDSRANKRPILSDLEKIGDIERFADLVLFLYRDEVYFEDFTPDKGIAELIIAKQCNGPLATVRLLFLNQYLRFEDFVDHSVYE